MTSVKRIRGRRIPRRSAPRVFARGCLTIHSVLPFPLSGLPVTFIGYCIINGLGFLIDMGLLAVFFRGVGLPYPISVSLGYGLSAIYSFFVNRWLNFQSHGDLGRQSGRYVITIVTNYVCLTLGFSSLLEHIGVHFELARFTAACVEGLYVYFMLSLWVFPKSGRRQLA
ncbi:hypothetical protein HMPREF1279_01280 [Propionibacterium sp. KPL1852]|nr:hypothetical protein HMPREF1301_01589 [Propionibacterium sp. KPL2005]ERS29125.1 hypothetical protein HMPREF1297_01298 [Propionibacterium sp. KPL2000]ERS37574.1 hypothetical protein HMPREF1271_02116 [Propionibacterium sp. KPL1838]ERS68068.1 hypothetical protein HMPREF1279_01280 [Propionibacterium sp. KPL1852]